MSPTSSTLVVVFAVFAVLTAVVAAAAAGRRSAGGWAVAGVCLLLSPLLAASTGLVAVNQQVQMFTRWSQLTGGQRLVDPGVARRIPLTPRRTPRTWLPRPRTVFRGRAGSEVKTVLIAGSRSGITLPAYAYLPAAYFTPTDARTRFPVIEALAGFPGAPGAWLKTLHLTRRLDTEIAAGRMPPTVVVLPEQQLVRYRDPECVDPAHGPRMGTFLSTDVLTYTKTHFRVRPDRASWGVVGYSTGGFCAVDLAYRHPTDYTAAVSLSGYFTPLTDRFTGPLYAGRPDLRLANDPLWQTQHGHIPDLSLYLACGGSDTKSITQIRTFVAAARPPLTTTAVVLPTGGHAFSVWWTLTAPMLDWFAAHLTQPTPPPPGR